VAEAAPAWALVVSAAQAVWALSLWSTDMKKAWIENARIRDVAPGNPADLYVPEIAQFYDTDVPDDAANGDGWVDGQLVKPTPTPPAPLPPRKWSDADVRAGLSLAERVKWDSDSSNTIKTAKIEMATPQELAHTTEVLQMLVDAGDISAASMAAILA
jgi:hypothetical protein